LSDLRGESKHALQMCDFHLFHTRANVGILVAGRKIISKAQPIQHDLKT
jgi:hypothetical protein